MLKPSAALLFALFAAPAAARAGETGVNGWPVRSSPHFLAHYESAWSSNASIPELESVYARLKMNIKLFAPGMLSRKIGVYIYKDRDSYLRGEFKPPKDTAGMAYARDLAIITYDSGGVNEFRDVFAHEITHLYFESFFGGRRERLPGWLNEGMAVLAGDQAHGGRPWTRSLECFPPEEMVPPSRFLSMDLSDMSSDDKRYDWYLEAFGITAWLFRPEARLEFKSFCALLKEGRDPGTALRRAYRLKDPAALDRAWRDWLRTSVQAGRGGGVRGLQAPACEFRPAGFSPFSLKSR